MDDRQFSPDQRQFLVKTIEGAWAFVPPPLPPVIDLNTIALPLAAASSAIGELNGAARRVRDPYMLIAPLTRKEALTSSAMEGTITTIDEMLLQEITPDTQKDDDAREASNYVRSLRHATEAMKKLPVSGRLLRESHKLLLSGLSASRGAGKRPGEYKIQQNAVGQQGDSIFTARYVPPPPAQTLDCMATLEAFINRENRLAGEELIDLALAHYQFEAIHPFQDGNGRIGRMLVTLMAMQLELVKLPLLHISATLEDSKAKYIELLYSVSAQGEWKAWIEFFLQTVQKSCRNATSLIDRAIDLHLDLRQRVLQSGKNHRLATIVDELFSKEWITAPEIERLCKVSFPTAQSDIQELVKLDILTPIANTRPAIFVARPIWNLSRRD